MFPSGAVCLCLDCVNLLALYKFQVGVLVLYKTDIKIISCINHYIVEHCSLGVKQNNTHVRENNRWFDNKRKHLTRNLISRFGILTMFCDNTTPNLVPICP